VYVLVTRRMGRLLVKPGTPVQRYTVRRDDPLQIADIEEFVRDRVARDNRIADALVSSDPPVSAPIRAASVKRAYGSDPVTTRAAGLG
jgi:hypothetical protein